MLDADMSEQRTVTKHSKPDIPHSPISSSHCQGHGQVLGLIKCCFRVTGDGPLSDTGSTIIYCVVFRTLCVRGLCLIL